ncbi:methyl-accepting chemotaxis protein [Acanthopleuribacter pedis]|uniref:Methyl-accepting transducer domain-containing protein n=1 Tax=Acanthopleuribacter pedis TaxID=442870 RepID=A0A8J7Q778_9BACT|nr:methyl-accepting chemotaxis protein [Acanthopleuribacter pedis]MBO1321892.1 hypothetical protein [Acanthopleuribacter pedis]
MSSDVGSQVQDAAAFRPVGRPLWLALVAGVILSAAAAGMSFWQTQQANAARDQLAADQAAHLKLATLSKHLTELKAAWTLFLLTGDETHLNQGREAFTALQQGSRALSDLGFAEEPVQKLNGEVAAMDTSLTELQQRRAQQQAMVKDTLLPAVGPISADLADIRQASAGAGRTEVVALIDALLPQWQAVADGVASPAVVAAPLDQHPLQLDWAALTAQFQAIAGQMRSAAYRQKGADMVGRVEGLATAATGYLEGHGQFHTLYQAAVSDGPEQLAAAIANLAKTRSAAGQTAAPPAAIIIAVLLVVAWLGAFLAVRGFLAQINGGLNTLSDREIRLAEGDRDLEPSTLGSGDTLTRAGLAQQALAEHLAAEEEQLQARHTAELEAAVAAQQAQAREQGLAAEKQQELEAYREQAARWSELLSTVVALMQNAARNASELTLDMASVTQQTGETTGLAGDGISVVAENTRHVFELLSSVSERTDAAAQVAQTSGQNADAVEGLIEDLSDSALGIDSVIELIEKIVGATRLLSLNASIEAARSGEAGRGFAVIAAEIKSLSDQTAEATEEIRDKINRIKDCTRTVTDAVGGITRVIHELDEIIGTISGSVESQRNGLNAISEAAVTADDSIQSSSASLAGLNDTVSGLQKAVVGLQKSADEIAETATQGSLAIR